MTVMELLVLHGTFVDEFLIELVLPLSIFVGLYWWSSRKAKKKRTAKADAVGAAPAEDAAAGRGES